MYPLNTRRRSNTYPCDNARFEDLSKSIPQYNDYLKKNKVLYFSPFLSAVPVTQTNASVILDHLDPLIQLNLSSLHTQFIGLQGPTHPDGYKRGGVEGREQHGVAKHQDKADGESDLQEEKRKERRRHVTEQPVQLHKPLRSSSEMCMICQCN